MYSASRWSGTSTGTHTQKRMPKMVTHFFTWGLVSWSGTGSPARYLRGSGRKSVSDAPASIGLPFSGPSESTTGARSLITRSWL
jgi:hypothetical protein